MTNKTVSASLLVSLLTVSMVLTSCATDQAARYYADARYPARPTEEVAVLHSTPTRPYEVIADFQARGASVAYMQRQAAKIGADAVIIGMFGGIRSHAEHWAGEDRHSRTYSRIAGTAIIYKD